MKKVFLAISIIILITDVAFAQKENNVWAFGYQVGIDFNTSPPTMIEPAMTTNGGSASVCDTNGQLLFYTQGDTIWDKNGQVMPNGAGLIAPYFSNSVANGLWCAQGQLIVPVINNQNQYYVFTIQDKDYFLFSGDTAAGRLYYSVVDMSLNGGLGDVVQGQKEILLDSMLTSEKMISISGDSCSVWLLVHRIDSAMFKAYKINSAGINTTPVISNTGIGVGVPYSYLFGKMKASPDGTKIVTTNLYDIYSGSAFVDNGCELFDFDAATGVVSNPVELDTNSIAEGLSACFSPDNSKLYYFYSDFGYGNLYQFDLSQPTTNAIIGSMTILDSLTNFGLGTGEYDARIGPDGKVYTCMPFSVDPSMQSTIHDTISVIDSPNLAGLACAYNHAALYSSQPAYSNGDFPNVFVRPRQDTALTSGNLNLTQAGNAILQAPSSYTHYMWNTGDTTDTITVTNTGTYWVTDADYCSYSTDTFYVKPALGISNVLQQTNGIRVYPNPATDDITVTANNAKGTGHINITDILGKTVIALTTQGNSTHINIAGLAAGVYEIIYTNDNAPATHLRTSLVISK